MKAICWHGSNDVRLDSVPEPKILDKRDAVVKVTATAICGSDLHLMHGYIPSMEPGDILGHEFMGEVVAVGTDVPNLKSGDRVVVPFAIACGACFFCQHKLTSLCDNTNPNAAAQEKLYGASTSGIFGYSHLFGGYAGGQAEYARVPFADVGAMKVPETLSDEQVLFLSDTFPTAWMAAENCEIEPGDTVAIWGCGSVGLLAIKAAFLLGAERVISIDNVPERLEKARTEAKAEVLNYDDVDILEKLKEITGGIGPDACIDAVGMEAHGSSLDAIYDYAKQAVRLETDRPHVLRQAIQACRKGGSISVSGLYGGFIDKFPIGVAFGKGLTFKMGQTHVHRYMKPLMERIEKAEIDPSFIISHRVKLSDGPKAYEIFSNKQDNCIKVVMRP
jgi:threonine dehydrogenase-like Zn-dependent dehydrogenase